ncbi:hypothetical protein K504DRAFT_446254 [Pleomassaria siparia CBS 279.74]|uniref:S-adenosyl-L-methionine-dependent methyltransferase n=1 Tax=Pleomassaria siparia CBS 279.74 TaxID=1314801 RepID=A0A6G1KRC6_9PLEO|nr:hypothetical protein K504DRAFT_446254 [Pleomassaria siparia CBS 279.74]
MEEEPPQPDDPARDHTAAGHKRARTDSGRSTSPESLDSAQSTRTLDSDDFTFIEENGRIYGNDIYYMPCDQTEQDRLTIQHRVFVYALKGKLSTTPMTNSMARILDLCTGPGNWAIAVAQQFPSAEVVGIDMAVWDIETTEADAGGGRVTWEIDDLDIWGVDLNDTDDLTTRFDQYHPFFDPTERDTLDLPAKGKAAKAQSSHAEDLYTHSESKTPFPPSPSFNPYMLEQPGWHFSEPFDLIHMRNCKGIFAYWEDVYAEIYKNLTPGGWVEVADWELIVPTTRPNAEPEPGTSPQPGIDTAPLPILRRLYLAMMEASFKSGHPLGSFYMHPTYLEDAGFKDVRTTYVNVPIGPWPNDPEQKKIGKIFLVVFYETLEAHLLRLLTKWGDKRGRWTADEVRLEIEKGKEEIKEWCEGPNDKGMGESSGVMMGIEGEGAAEGQPPEQGWCASFKWICGRKSKNA